MKTTSLPILGIFFSVALLFVSNASAQDAVTSMSSIVTASDYCAFLNQAAVTDPYHLYDTAMSTDPEAACILRVGAPGNWHYEVIAGREKFPITYLNEFDKKKYCDEMDLSRLSSPSHIMCDGVTEADQNKDPFLRSNQSSFSVTEPNATTLSLNFTTVTLTPSLSSWNTGDTLLLAAATIGLGFLGAHCSQEAPLKAYETPEFKEHNTAARENHINEARLWRQPPEDRLQIQLPEPSAPPIEKLQEQNAFDPKYIDSNVKDIPTNETNEARNKRKEALETLKKSLASRDSQLNQALGLPLRSEAKMILKDIPIMKDIPISINICLPKYLPLNPPDPRLPQLQQDTRQFLLYDLFQEMEKLLQEPTVSDENKTGHANYVAQNVNLLHSVLKNHLEYERQFIIDQNIKLGISSSYDIEYALDRIFCRRTVGNQLIYFYKSYRDAKEKLTNSNKYLQKIDTWMRDAHNSLHPAEAADLKFLNEQKWNVLYEHAKGRPFTEKALARRYENYLHRLECPQRLQELRNAEQSPSNKDQLMKAYEAWHNDLTTNPTLGLTTGEYLRYAWEQQEYFRFRDEYGIAPYLTTSMAIPINLIRTAIGIGIVIIIGCS